MQTFEEVVGEDLWNRANAGLLSAKELMVWVEHFFLSVQEPLIQNWYGRARLGNTE